tara:strand:- start:6002 stop:6775 length:774 start_codon:yes stop_codon:yes gene_type:complete
MTKILLKEIPLGDFKGVLFDKDGTLTNSEFHLISLANSRIDETVNKLQKNINEIELHRLKVSLELAYGITSKGLNPHGCIAIGSRYENLISTATLISTVTHNWPEAINLAREIFANAEIKKSQTSYHSIKRPILPGVKTLLVKLKDANLKCGIISNDTNQGIKEFIRVNNLESQFCGYWSCENSPSKPDPNAIKEFCKTLNLAPSECILFGDSDSDLQMARKAGIGLAIGYISGWKIKPDLNFQQELISDWKDITCP